MSDYPEHDKLSKVAEISQEQGALLDWLQEHGTQLMRYETWTESTEERCPTCGWWPEKLRLAQGPCRRHGCDNTGVQRREFDAEGWVHDRRSIPTILAEYHGIDPVKLEQEKRAMLATINGRGGGRGDD